MAIQKKHGKGRLDKYYHLAKEKGYRARAAFKLIHLNKKYSFLQSSKVVLDLCAAPGSWTQVAAATMPVSSLLVAVDLTPIKPIPKAITFQSDITTPQCRATIRQHLKSWKADTVLHDGAPNVGRSWLQDAYSQAELVLQALKLATEFLAEGGTFVSKVFRSKDYNSLLWVFNQLFNKVEATKPPSSRNVSAEIFVVCRGYKAPKRIDPKFLDSRSVFAELGAPTPNNEAKVFDPEKQAKKRKREGYEEGDWTQFREASVVDFVQSTDPIAMLGSMNKLSFEQKPGGNGDLALKTLEMLPETTQELRDCCADLKVLGRKEFRNLLRWRLKVRDRFGFSEKKKAEAEEKRRQEEAEGEEHEKAEVESMDEELKLQEDLQRLKEKGDKQKRKERKKENERKRKEIIRMQMNMTAPMEIGMEQAGPNGEDAMFALKIADNAKSLAQLAKGKMHSVVEAPAKEESDDEREDRESDDEEDELERQLDTMYDDYKERKALADAKYRARKARKDHGKEHEEEEGEFEGFSDREPAESSDDLEEDEDSDDESHDDAARESGLITDLKGKEQPTAGLSMRAVRFFDQDIFKGIEGLDSIDDDSGIDVDEGSTTPPKHNVADTTQSNAKVLSQPQRRDQESEAESDKSFEMVKRGDDDAEDWNEGPSRTAAESHERPNIDIITAEAMTLAHQLATGQKTKEDLIDDNFNKYSHRDVDGLPDWFLDDETKHSRPHRPITAAAARAIKEKQLALNARPIKKVREARDRKRYKAARRLEKVRQKAGLLAEEEGVSEGDKAKNVARLMARAARKKPKQKVNVVVAKGGNRGISGRPKGTKGKYKMVDARLKKDVRATKRIAKRK
ncbi:FtsJ-domain-containing protein [Viridothelium virens]|uniref:FtsJ-domain-containing protein n=1 Tax=Viridothelium virens TaxID=1048519 RepID=A0A6A6HDL3_VIRVR|nr:FtsJ-domain-containing protein [Viridothelium virens]